MKMHASITEDRIIETIQQDDNLGICVKCGADQDCVEPDAEKYLCSECNRDGVYGAEQLLFYVAS
jgi:hypothetical protein